MYILPDVNILVAAHRLDHPAHQVTMAALDHEGHRGFALCPHLWNGFIRLVTHPSIFSPPTPLSVALDTVREWRQRPTTRILVDTPSSWETFEHLCRQHRAQGNAVYDLHLVALAITHRCLLVSSDQGFARIDGLRWKTPDVLL